MPIGPIQFQLPHIYIYEYGNDDEYAEFADARDEEENLFYRNARSRDAARARSLTRGAARDLREDRDSRSERERRVGTLLEDWRRSMTEEDR